MSNRATDRNSISPAPEQLLQFGKEHADAMLNVQKELFEAYQKVGQAWMARMQTELELCGEMAGKMMSCRSLPEGLKVYGDSVTRRMQMMAEDGRRLYEDSSRLMAAMTGSFNGHGKGE